VTHKSAVAILPARMGSTRLPGKLLLSETGRPLIRHAYERAAKARSIDRVVVATDDARIVEAVEAFGGEAVMTRADHETGTERVAEAAAGLDADIVVNVQGDEPEIDPHHLDALVDTHARSGAFCSTLVCPFPEDRVEGPGSPADPASVKALLTNPVDGVRFALYFSRALAPFPRATGGRVERGSDWRMHVGVYAFSKDSLAAYVRLPPGPLARMESLEQLRILEAGERIAAEIVPAAAPGIDTPEDYAAFVARWGDRASS